MSIFAVDTLFSIGLVFIIIDVKLWNAGAMKLTKHGGMEDIMIREGLEQGIVAIAAGGISAGAVLLRLMLSGNYRRLVRASNSMADVKKKWLKQLKMKFEAMYQVGIGVHNVDVFVDKYINQRKVLGINLSTWESVSGQATLLCGVSAVGAVLFGMYYNCEQTTILSTVMAGIGGMALIRFVDNFSCLDAKKKQLSRNLIDYFENYSKVRLEQELLSAKPDNTEEIVPNEEAAPALAEEVDFIQEETFVPSSRREEKALKRQEKQNRKKEAKEYKRRQKEEREEMRLKMNEENHGKDEEETLEELQRRKEEKQRERKARALEELRQMEEAAGKQQEAAETVTATDIFAEPEINAAATKESAGTEEKVRKEKRAASNTVDTKLKAEHERITEKEETAATGESEISPAEEIMQGLKLDNLAQIKKQNSKEEDKLIEEVLRQFLA